jgi:hypothetical protein
MPMRVRSQHDRLGRALLGADVWVGPTVRAAKY